MGQEENSTGRSQGSCVWVFTCVVLNADRVFLVLASGVIGNTEVIFYLSLY